jgi:riboflavin kinase / FMN adenylyltransferase
VSVLEQPVAAGGRAGRLTCFPPGSSPSISGIFWQIGAPYVKLLRDLRELTDDVRGGAVAIGNFDGVHWGHAAIVQRLRLAAQDVGGPPVVFTFDPHPVRLLRPEVAPPPLTWTDRKAELLGQLGVDVVLAYPTDRQLLELTPEAFFQQIVVESLAAGAMVEGPNFHFGRERQGNVTLLRTLCRNQRIKLEIVEPALAGSEYISSSRTREAIGAGRVEEARQYLTQPYRIRGMVTHGARRGATLGFPTANLEAIDTLIPATGVYAGRAYVEGAVYPAATSIGPNPTFGEHGWKVETHLLDFRGSLYGQPLEVDFLARLRDIRTFASAEKLGEQLTADLQLTRRVQEMTVSK